MKRISSLLRCLRRFSTAEDNPVLIEKRGALATMILNRPRALNALTLEMVTFINQQAKVY